MGIVDLGRRIELFSMDPHCHDISIALYERGDGTGSFTVHSYSRRPEAAARLDGVATAMRKLGGMVAGAGPRDVRFCCGAAHRLAVRRLFLDACKPPPGTEIAPRAMVVLDKKSGQTITAHAMDGGRYRLSGDGDDPRRVLAVARGLVRLAEMEAVEGADCDIAFACGYGHDALIGLLMVRALNLRAVMREIEMQAARGVLAAPSARD